MNIKPFESDGCSVMSQLYKLFTSGRKTLPWRRCCVRHDVEYWVGGTAIDRLYADQKLRKCVANCGYPFIGDLMYLAVRAGGAWFWPTPWRWGYGFKYGQRNRTRDGEMILQCKAEHRKLNPPTTLKGWG